MDKCKTDAPLVQKLPQLTRENLDAIMAERMAAVKNEKTAIPMLWQGLLELDIPVEGMEGRTAKIYVPRNCRQTANFVLMNVPEGEDTVDFLERSGWTRLADLHQLCLFVLEPGEGGWKTPEEELPYIQAGHCALRTGAHLLAGFSDYMVGYGPVGACLQWVAMHNPLRTAAAVFLDACTIPEDTVRSFQRAHYTEANPYGPVREYDFVNGDLPVPVWIISRHLTDQERTLADYWKTAARAGDTGEDPILGCVYRQNEDSIFTPEGHLLQVALQEKAVDYTAQATTEAILGFLLRYYRYGQGACSNMISLRPDLRAMGVEYRSFTDGNGFQRQYLVYIPQAYRSSREKLPMIINFHGAQQSMEDMFANSQWYHIADQLGLIIVCAECVFGRSAPQRSIPQAGVAAYPLRWLLNDRETPDRVFVDEMLDRLIAEFPVDEKRIYADGHSMGCMMANYLASGPVAHRFAAFCGTSGAFLTPEDQDVGGSVSPVWVSYGEYDMFGDCDPASPGLIMDMLSFWLKRDGLATEENAEQVRSGGADEVYTQGRYHHFVWKNQKGVPILHYNWVARKAHTHTPEENSMFWKEWLSKWSLDDAGNRLYENQAIE